MNKVKVPAKTREVFELLVRCSNEMRTITYGELAEHAKLDPSGIGLQLGFIRDSICRDRGYPWLNMVAVSTSTRRPGDAFLPPGVSAGPRDEELLWRGMVIQVFSFDWKNIPSWNDLIAEHT